MGCATTFPSNITISMRLPDSASIFTAELWVVIKTLEQIKESIAFIFIIFTDSILCLHVYNI